jgi:hypothetical protein
MSFVRPLKVDLSAPWRRLGQLPRPSGSQAERESWIPLMSARQTQKGRLGEKRYEGHRA